MGVVCIYFNGEERLSAKSSIKAGKLGLHTGGQFLYIP
jgi:hypothetical protein